MASKLGLFGEHLARAWINSDAVKGTKPVSNLVLRHPPAGVPAGGD